MPQKWQTKSFCQNVLNRSSNSVKKLQLSAKKTTDSNYVSVNQEALAPFKPDSSSDNEYLYVMREARKKCNENSYSICKDDQDTNQLDYRDWCFN